jgi:hypothetical protein
MVSYKPVPRGWCVGSKEFRAEMLEYIQEQQGKWHYGAELSESADAKAQRLIAEALGGGGISLEQLASWRKGHPFKVAARVNARSRPEGTPHKHDILSRPGKRVSALI